MSNIQALLFDKHYYNINDVNDYLKNHNLKKLKPYHITDNYIRVRLIDPNKFTHYFTLEKKKGIKMIIGIS